ncbi:hypothetical protein HK104_004893 [Borealophlyctis nickersoniae]|nr:hypothetical protein HK104_004893 [Borealophlyctis nickersoniae]
MALDWFGIDEMDVFNALTNPQDPTSGPITALYRLLDDAAREQRLGARVPLIDVGRESRAGRERNYEERFRGILGAGAEELAGSGGSNDAATKKTGRVARVFRRVGNKIQRSLCRNVVSLMSFATRTCLASSLRKYSLPGTLCARGLGLTQRNVAPHSLTARQDLIRAADFHQLPALHALIAELIVEEDLNKSTARDLLAFAHTHGGFPGCDVLRRACLAVVREHLKSYELETGFAEWLTTNPEVVELVYANNGADVEEYEACLDDNGDDSDDEEGEE